MDDLGHPPDAERLRVGFTHAMDLITNGEATAVIVTAVLRGRKVRIWAAGEDEARQKMEDIMRQALYALAPNGEVPATGRDAAADD